jgi:Ca2+-transporting ATPase
MPLNWVENRSRAGQSCELLVFFVSSPIRSERGSIVQENWISTDEEQGLDPQEAERRLTHDGPNEIVRDVATPWLTTVLRQFRSPVIGLLAGASLIAAWLGEFIDASAIAAIVVMNAVVGALQESRAENAVLALRSLTAPRARVIRGGKAIDVAAADVVVGDLLLLDAGDIVAADGLLLRAHRLHLNEAPLTGESLPVAKRANGEEYRVFMGTSVTDGTGLARVVATAMSTELGKIARLLADVPVKTTPLQIRLKEVSKTLIYLCLAIVVIVAGAGYLQGRPLFDVFMVAVSLAVAAVPEGLPAVVTIALALGVERMAAKHVLVRRLPAIETLGCATVICTDKTGTLTTGVMKVRELWSKDETALLDAAAACCDAQLDADHTSGIGDPTEIAILVAASERGIRREVIEAQRKRVAVAPFDSERKRMSIWRSDNILYVKGGMESISSICTNTPQAALEKSVEMAKRGLRVLAVALGHHENESDLELLGLIGLADPPRPEAIAAIAKAKRAGISTVMITGDHPETALAIAIEMGILEASHTPTGVVHARATPAEKLHLVRAWKERGAVVAMTGDGVNDAPALREADVGIAMGKSGTEVAREAADLVVSDDNFASIVEAIHEGRGIFDNIRKTLVFLLAGNSAELMVMLAASLAGYPFPLLALHLLWINLVTDGLPALALVMDEADPHALQRPPRNPKEPMLGGNEWIAILVTGALQSAVTLSAFVWALRATDLPNARNFAFSTLVFGEVLRSLSSRNATKTLWEIGLLTNWRLLAVVAFSVGLQLMIQNLEWTQRIFHIGALTWQHCLLSVALGFVPITLLELFKVSRKIHATMRAAT